MPAEPGDADVLADALREHLIAEKPDHALADEVAWRRRRAKWVREMGAVARARDRTKALELLAWVFGDQGGKEFRFRVDSPQALREKWDRIEVAMRAPPMLRLYGGNGAPVRDRAAEIMAKARELEEKGL